MNAVRRAGKALSGSIPWEEEKRDEILEIFAIAHSWRDAHIYPMRSMRQSLVGRIRHSGHKGFTAARPKRMTSIRKKLRRFSVKLDQIQDLAGCRAVMDDMAGVNALVESIKSKLPHELIREYPYIQEIKDDGYRSHHMVYRFQANADEMPYDDLRVEVQIRTRLQHSWATAVEAVGLFREEDFKAGEGSPDWLRLFRLMSEEFAVTEGCGDFVDTPTKHRLEEIRHLNDVLNAANVLDDLKNATKFMEDYLHEESPYYMITYNLDARSVKVHPEADANIGSSRLDAAETQIETTPGNRSKVVLVEVDKLENLIEAYPNYFGDVTLFVRNLKAICQGDAAVEFTMKPQEVVPKPKAEVPDLSWFFQGSRRKWVETPKRSGKR